MDRLEIRTKLASMGITSVECHYSGGGDSGAVDDITYRKIDGLTTTFENDVLQEAIQDLFWEAANTRAGSGWYNNDGGAGTIEWQVPTDDVNHQHAEYYTATNDYEYDEWPDAS